MADQLTAVLFALSREATPFRRLAGCIHPVVAPCPAWTDQRFLLVVETGMGAEACRRALDWLLMAHSPGRIVSAGFCGSLVAALPVGTVLRPTAIREEDDSALIVVTDPEQQITLVSVDAPILDRQAREQLRVRTGAAIVDMESATIASRCAAEGIAFAGLRVVTDDLARPLPAELATVVEGERVRTLALVAALLRRPALGLDLIRLAWHSRKAALALAQGLAQLLDLERWVASGA